MKKKLKIALKRHSSEQGFALPVAVGMGLILTLVAATMIARSKGDQVTASAQKVTADSFDVSEVGVSRVQALLKRFPKMAGVPLASWGAEYDRFKLVRACLGSTADESIADGNWTNVDNSVNNVDLSRGEIRVSSYTVTGVGTVNMVGTLTVEGRARSESASASTSIDNATTSLQVQIPVVPLDNLPVPGLLANTFDMGNNDVRGNILVPGCVIPAGVSTANIVAGTGSLTANPSVEFPPLPDLPATDVYTLPAIAGSTTLPRPAAGVTPADIPDINNVYRYLVGKNGAGNSISLSGTQVLRITAGRKVTLYLQGNINMVGNSEIQHTGTPTTNFQIYGSDGVNRYKAAAGDPNTTTDSITLSGATSANMFLYAPLATVGINGGGTITGSVWANSWDGSNANNVVITQSANWTDLPMERLRSISAIQSWQRGLAN